MFILILPLPLPLSHGPSQENVKLTHNVLEIQPAFNFFYLPVAQRLRSVGR